MGQFLAKPTRFAFIILTTCVVPVISFGDDGMQLHTPSIPTKTLPASSTCPMWGSVAAYQPTWHERQSLIVRVQFTNAGDAAQVFQRYALLRLPECADLHIRFDKRDKLCRNPLVADKYVIPRFE